MVTTQYERTALSRSEADEAFSDLVKARGLATPKRTEYEVKVNVSGTWHQGKPNQDYDLALGDAMQSAGVAYDPNSHTLSVTKRGMFKDRPRASGSSRPGKPSTELTNLL